MAAKQYQAPALQAIARSIVLMPSTENTYVLELGERKKLSLHCTISISWFESLVSTQKKCYYVRERS